MAASKAAQKAIQEALSAFSGTSAEKQGLESFISSLKHSDLPTGWQDNPAIVDAAAKMYQQGGTESPFFKAYEGVRGKTERAYHGTKANFDVFDVDKMGEQGTSQGRGFYTSPSKDFAKGYGGNVMDLFVATEKSFTPKSKKLSSANIRNILLDSAKADSKMYDEDISDSFLSNYGDIRHEGMGNVLREYTRDLMDNDNPIDQINDIIASGANYSNVMDSVAKRTGKTGYVPPSEFERVSFLPQNIKSTSNRGTFDPNDPNILRGIGIGAAGLGAGAAAMAPSQSEAALPNLEDRWVQYDALVKAGLLKEEQGLEEPVWSPTDLPVAAVGVPGTIARALALALDAPATIGADYALGKIGNVGKHINERWLY